MTAKEYLNKGYAIAKQIRSIQIKIADLQMSACTLSAVDTTRESVQGGEQIDRTQRNIETVEKLQAKIEQLRKEQQPIYIFVTKFNAQYHDILDLHYIDGLTWEKVAKLTGKSIRTVYKLHGDALKSVADFELEE